MESLPERLDAVLGPRDVVVVEGPDAQTYLHSQVSQDLRGMVDGEQRWTFVLEPTGKIDAFARVTRISEERYELDVDAGFGEGLRTRLDRFRIRVRAETSLVESVGEVAADEALRIELAWPRLGAEIVPGDTIPAGTGLTGVAVSFTKGCYPGQELVERMDSRGADAPRALQVIDVADGTGVGEPVVVDGEEIGTVTSVVGTRALAWIKRGRVAMMER
jgi:folate-binding protein YgfZ